MTKRRQCWKGRTSPEAVESGVQGFLLECSPPVLVKVLFRVERLFLLFCIHQELTVCPRPQHLTWKTAAEDQCYRGPWGVGSCGLCLRAGVGVPPLRKERRRASRFGFSGDGVMVTKIRSAHLRLKNPIQFQVSVCLLSAWFGLGDGENGRMRTTA